VILKNAGYKKSRNTVLRCFCLAIGISFLNPIFCQFKLSIQVKDIPASHTDQPIFVAGNFNGWEPGNVNYQLQQKNNIRSIEIKDLVAGTYEFKFTKGTWAGVEITAQGKDITNRSVKLVSDTVLAYSIGGWADDFAVLPKLHSASSNVRVLDSAFKMPQLNRQRRIGLYLPPGYKKSKKRYPVIYMQDGQNLFDEYTAAFGEWGVDESLDSLIAHGKPPCIIVAIDNGGEWRMNEYNPFEFTLKDSLKSKTFPPEGDEYLEFIAKTLKPFIDKHYRTKPSRENTIIAGSSMGGLISYYALLKYPKIFGKAGVFSPSFWTAEGIDHLTDSLSGALNAKIFFYMGEAEGADDVARMNHISETIGQKSFSMVCSVIDPDGQHNEQAWRKWFAEFYKWIMADGFNVINPAKN
jgi:predicted alpha/beta superfamily hydrolase